MQINNLIEALDLRIITFDDKISTSSFDRDDIRLD